VRHLLKATDLGNSINAIASDTISLDKNNQL